MAAPSASSFLDEPAPPKAADYLDAPAPQAPVASDFLDQPSTQERAQQMAATPNFDPAQHAAQNPDDFEAAYQADKIRGNRSIPEKAAAIGSTFLQPSTYWNGAKGAWNFLTGFPQVAYDAVSHAYDSATGNPEALTKQAEATIEGQKMEESAGHTIDSTLGAVARGAAKMDDPDPARTAWRASFARRNPAEAAKLKPEWDAQDAADRQERDEQIDRNAFTQRVQTAKNAMQLAQGRPLDTGMIASIYGAGGQTPSQEVGPEALQEAGAPAVNQSAINRASAAADPNNILLSMAPQLPGAKFLGGKAAEYAGKAMQIPGKIASSIPGRIGKSAAGVGAAGLAAAETAIHSPATAAGIAAGVGASKGLQWLGQGIEAQGKAAAEGVPSALDTTAANASMAGKSAAGANAQRFVGDAATNAASTAIGMAPVNAATSESPEDFARSEVGAAAFGGALSALHSSRAALVEAARPALRQKGVESQDLNSSEGRASAQFINGLPEAQKNTALEITGALAGLPVENAQGQQVPARMIVQSDADYQRTLKQLGIPTTPEGGGQGFFWAPDGTAYINGESSSFGDAQTAAQTMGHEFGGHAALNILKAAGAKGGPIYDGLMAKARAGLFQPDGKTPTPEFQKFIDAYNKSFDPTGQHQEINPNDQNSIDELLSETAGWIISQKGAADLAVPKGILDKITDGIGSFMSGLTGVDPHALGTGGHFDRTEVSSITKAVRDTLSQLAGLKLRGDGVMESKQTPDQYVQQLRETLAKPRPTDTAENVRAWQAEQASAAKALKDFQANPQQSFPAAGKAPIAPSVPAVQSPAAQDAIKAMTAMGIKPAEAAQHVQAAEQALGPAADSSALLTAATRIRQGVSPTVPTASTPINIERTGFNDQSGQRHEITGISQDPAKAGDFIVNSSGKIMRVIRVRPDGGLDTVFPATSNEQTTYPVDAGKYQVLTHEIPEPNQPLPKSPTVAAPGTITAPAEVAPTGNSAPAAVAVRKRVGPSIPDHPSGAPDIIDAIKEMGGIQPKGRAREAGLDQYSDQPENCKRGLYNQLYTGDMTPDDMAKALLENHGIGDGSTSKMWELIEKAIPERQGLAQQIRTEGQKQAKAQREFTQQEKEAASKISDDAEENETAAIQAEGKSVKAKVNQTRIRKAKIQAIMDAIGDDPNGLRQETDEFGNTRIVGDFDASNPLHQELAKIGGLSRDDASKVQALQDAKGQPQYIRYRSAKSDAEVGDAIPGKADMGKRQAEYEADPANTRKEGTVQHKVVIPLGTEASTEKGAIGTKVFTVDNLLHNAASIFEGMKESGIPNPYGETPDEQQAQLVQDSNDYAENHAHGFRGDGSGPMQGFPDSNLPKPDPNYAPKEIPKDRFDVLNLMMHDESGSRLAALTARMQADQAAGKETPKSIRAQFAKAQETYALAEENQRWIDHDSGETNQLRQQLKANGFDTGKRFKSPFETLAPQHILEMSTSPIAAQEGDIPTVRPTGFDVDPAQLAKEGIPNSKAARAGFRPEELSTRGYALGGEDAYGKKRILTFPSNDQGYHSWDSTNHPGDARNSKWRYKNGTLNWVQHDPTEQDFLDVEDLLASKGLKIVRQKDWATGEEIIPKPSFRPEIERPEDIAKDTGVEYQGEANGLHAFKEPTTGGNFSIPANGMNRENVARVRDAMKASFEGTPEIGSASDANIDRIIAQAKAGFRPDSGTPEEGETQPERLTREAEQAGVVLKTDDIKGLMRQDPAVLARIRARIEQNTGSPARFRPDDRLTPDNIIGNIRDYAANRNSKRATADYRDAISADLKERQSAGEGAEADSPDAQNKALIQWANENGTAIRRRPWDIDPKNSNNDGGREHDVFYDEPSQRWIKTTKPGNFGMFPTVKNGEWTLSRATPENYIERLNGMEKLFGIKTPIHGIVVEPVTRGQSNFSLGTTQPEASIITSQPNIRGENITDDQIESKLKEQGFQSISDDAAAYYRPSDNTAILDAHPGNLTIKDGKLIGFDVIVIQPKGELKSLFERDHAKALERQPAPKGKGNFMEKARQRQKERELEPVH